MSQSLEQSLREGSVQVTTNKDELYVQLTNGSFKVTETINPNNRSYEMRHFRASMLRWQHDGSVLLVARNSELAPNLGYLDVLSTGYTHITSGHNIVLTAEGCAKTGGGAAGSADNKGFEIKTKSGDIHIQSDGKGGIYITSAANIEFRCPGDMIFNAGGQISMNTGAKDVLSGGLSEGIGSGKFVVSTGSYELATATYKETVTGSKDIENYGEINQQQKVAIAEPTLPQQHITTTETVGSLVHKIGYDYVLEVDGKMLLKVNNNPAKKVGGVLGGPGAAMGYATQTLEAFKQEINGTRATYLRAQTNPYAQDYLSIDRGNWYCEVETAAPGNTAISAGSLTKGDVVFQTTAQGSIGIQSGPTPSNSILVQNQGGSIRVEANGAKGMIQMLATQEIRGTAIRINLN
jgi:hypothetical protein